MNAIVHRQVQFSMDAVNVFDAFDIAKTHAGLLALGITLFFKKDTWQMREHKDAGELQQVCMRFNNANKTHFERLATSRYQPTTKPFFEQRLEHLGLGMTLYEYDEDNDNMCIWITVPFEHMKLVIETALDQLLFMNAVAS